MKNNIKISPFGNLLVYQKGYTSDFVKQSIEKNKLNGLRIFDHLDKLESLDFLSDYSFLIELSIDCMHDQNYSFLKNLINLKHLSIGPSTTNNNEIVLNALINLESFAISWRKGKILGLENCQKITDLCLIEYKENNFTPVQMLTNLKTLRVKTASIKEVSGIENFQELEKLELGNCRSLKNIEGIEKLKKLNDLTLEMCSKIEDYSYLGGLSNLDELGIIDCKGINSIEFLTNLKSLKKLYILGNSDILDSNMLPAQNIPEVIYGHRQHYNVKIENNELEQRLKENWKKVMESAKNDWLVYSNGTVRKGF
ncbi:hypothetical protein FACS189434_13590 [Bacteroidia bacterium]|nr:hypothetical protein FACS189434_13590 [Bacteroidia bacterium]